MENSACIDIKKRSGCLSHLEDPDRLKSLFAQTLTTEQYTCWHVNATALERFSNDSFVTSFTDRFLHIDAEIITQDELLKVQQLTMLFYNAVIKDKMHVLPIYLTTFNVSENFQILFYSKIFGTLKRSAEQTKITYNTTKKIVNLSRTKATISTQMKKNVHARTRLEID